MRRSRRVFDLLVMDKRYACTGFFALGLAACTTPSQPALNGDKKVVFNTPFGYNHPLFVTPATTEHPAYVLCNGERCAYLDEDGRYTQMSEKERDAYRLGLRLAETRNAHGAGVDRPATSQD